MPAAAVIPAPIVYIRVAVVKVPVVSCLPGVIDPSPGCVSALPAYTRIRIITHTWYVYPFCLL